MLGLDDGADRQRLGGQRGGDEHQRQRHLVGQGEGHEPVAAHQGHRRVGRPAVQVDADHNHGHGRAEQHDPIRDVGHGHASGQRHDGNRCGGHCRQKGRRQRPRLGVRSFGCRRSGGQEQCGVVDRLAAGVGQTKAPSRGHTGEGGVEHGHDVGPGQEDDPDEDHGRQW